MSQIKGKNTWPDMLVRKFLHANGYRYQLPDKSFPAEPDTVYIAVGTEGQTAGNSEATCLPAKAGNIPEIPVRKI